MSGKRRINMEVATKIAASEIIRGRAGFSALRAGLAGDSASRETREKDCSRRGHFSPRARNQPNEVDVGDERSRSDGPNGRSSNRETWPSRSHPRRNAARIVRA